MNIGKVPPHDSELERIVIGSILTESQLMISGAEKLTLKSFYKPEHQEIYKAILSLYKKNDAIDILTLTNELRKTNSLDSVGGAYAVVQLTQGVGSTINFDKHIRIIKELEIKRGFIHLAGLLVQDSFSTEKDVFEQLAQVENEIRELSNSLNSSGEKLLGAIAKEVVDNLENLQSKKDKGEQVSLGVPSSLINLNEITRGYKPSDLDIIAARPGMGKTSFLIQEALHQARCGYKVGIISAEMSAQQIAQKFLVMQTAIDSNDMLKIRLTPDDFTKLKNAVAECEELGLFIDDTSGLNSLEIKSKISRWVAQYGIQIVYVDYLQLLRCADKVNNAEQETQRISADLKAAAKLNNIPVVALSQLSRDNTKRMDKRPQLSDLRSSGSIEQDASTVIFLHREGYYDKSLGNEAEVIVAKNRHGSTDTAMCEWIGNQQRFKYDPIGAFSGRINNDDTPEFDDWSNSAF